jgi:hypothetical protein
MPRKKTKALKALKPVKRVFAITLTEPRPFAFAGIWDAWKRSDGTCLETFAMSLRSPMNSSRRSTIVSPSSCTRATGNTTIINSTIAYNTGNGINLFSATWFGGGGNAFNASGNIVYGNGGFGITAVAASTSNNANLLMMLNAFGANTAGDVQNVPTGTGVSTLTADPFTNHSSGDYSLNNTVGGGALLKGVGFPATFTGLSATGHLDVGAVQSLGGSTPVAIYGA